MSAFATVTRNTVFFAIKFFHVLNAVVNSISSKYYLILTIFYHKLAKFEQNWMIRTTQNVDLFDKKPAYYGITISDISLAPF